MDPALLTHHLEQIDKKIIRKIIATAAKDHVVPVYPQAASSRSNPNKHTSKRKAPR
ncbi:hypothetical protein [Chitinophaga pinensis]|uniref:Uncharacterized protein n=1 Tax=Chitinophaga pinensis (strain ATCC 43595 / DSM 2588 / LMG 13176 / NBRC 15968 / NCIMB 11800 / UQM 2034) TaxID=485918 RepID=A0A979GMQ6_CHIPD|nr:hypothetical protein [Chitinophaga pinensis]ACU57528.1 hypothetical protein Cpin_0019 [Chitinophaga pinensis DSM 2588]